MSLNSSSLLRQWFFGSTGSDDKRLPPGRRLALFLLFVLILLGTGWLFLPLLDSIYIRMLALGGEVYYSFEGKNLDFSVRGTEIFFQSRARPRFEANLSPEAIYSNLVILMALVLPTPGMRLKRRAAVVAAALGLLYLSHVAFLVTKVEVTLVTVDHPIAGAAWLWKTLDNAFEIIGKAFFPIFIWLGLTLPYMMGLVDPLPTTSKDRPTGRNAPCPCGSGKKFKYCCGS